MRILIVCSSSGGHVYPGFRFGQYLDRCGEEVRYLGIRGEIEERILPKDALILTDLPKSFSRAVKSPKKTLDSAKKIREILPSFDAVVGFGGFITFFVAHLPEMKKVPLYLHEANLDIGDSNRFSLSRAQAIFTSFPATANARYKKKICFTGNPVSDDVTDRKKDPEYITFVFGSLGSKTLLDRSVAYLSSQDTEDSYLLITSPKYYEEYKNKLKSKKNVTVAPFMEKRELYKNTRLIFCRGGASTLSEVIKSRTNCVCIPSPYVKHNHQDRNARYLAVHHALTIVEEKDYDEKTIREMIDRYQTPYAEMERAAQKSFITPYPCVKMYMKIKYDLDKKE